MCGASGPSAGTGWRGCTGTADRPAGGVDRFGRPAGDSLDLDSGDSSYPCDDIHDIDDIYDPVAPKRALRS
ncbi:hypothetical protein GCM10010504_33580 [Streptomyces griseus]|nr:hypothetical protein GCM10010504_33580 [Streptomyces griseus]